jgi:COMPASS component SWD1
MNLALLDPYVRNALPDRIEDNLDDGMATCSAFNRRGTLLAVGCNDGRTVIWDFETRGIAKVLIGHVHPITAVSWSRNGRKILTSSTDWNLRLWDVLTASFDINVAFNSPILSSQIHPRGRNIAVASVWMDDPCLVDLATGEKKKLPLVDRLAGERQVTEDKADEEQAGDSAQNIFVKQKPVPNSVAQFNHAGDKIFAGNAKGIVSVIDVETLKVEHAFRVSNTAISIKSFAFSKDGEQFIVNCTDRVLRLYDKNYKLKFEFQDVVEKLHWKKCLFSSDNEHVIGGSAQKAEHKVYIWSRHSGHLEKILEGPKEAILDVEWHPLRSFAVTCGTSGICYLWGAQAVENWSAYAPGFTEFEENVEYIEREDEFDEVDEQEERKKRQKIDHKDDRLDEEEVDVTTPYKNNELSDEEDELTFLPSTIIPDSNHVHPSAQYKDYTSPDHKDRSKKKRKRKHLKRTGVILMEEDSK